MKFIKKLLLATAIILGTVASGFAQNSPEKFGDYDVIVTENGYAYSSTSPTQIRGELKGGVFYLFGKKDFIEMGLNYNIEDETRIIPVSIILNGDASTRKNGNATISDGDIVLTNILLDYDAEVILEAKEIYVLVFDNVYKYSLNGFADSFGFVYNYVADPFAADSDDPFSEVGGNTVNPELEKYLESFIKIAKLNNVDLSHIYNGEIVLEFGSLNNDRDARTGRAIAVALGSRDDNKVHIKVDMAVWSSMDELGRTSTMYHELAHDILNASHVNEVEGHLMHTHNQFENIVELVEAMAQIFSEYNNGTLRVFNENTEY